MFTWKRLSLSLGFLFLILIIGWTTWYFTIVRPKLIEDPITLYNTKSQITRDDTSDRATVETSQGQKISQEENETVDRHVEGGGTENAAPLVSKELNQHTHHLDESNDEELSAEELAKKKAEMERERKVVETYKARVNELGASAVSSHFLWVKGRDSEIAPTENIVGGNSDSRLHLRPIN